jgi:rhodanese-related sulfurtransferase
MKTIITICALMITVVCHAQTKTENVDAATFKKLIDEKKAILIDLRTDDELKTKGFIKGATQIDFLGTNSETIISRLDKKKTYLVYCAGGGRSGDCTELMKTHGFTHVVNLAKGFDDWKKKGFEVEMKK